MWSKSVTPTKRKKAVIGYAHKDTLCKGDFGWYYPVICGRKRFMKLMKRFGERLGKVLEKSNTNHRESMNKPTKTEGEI
jgi:hypothetical protein